MQITITDSYLWLPVDLSADAVRLEIYENETKVQEMDIRLGTEHVDFYGAWKAEAYRGRTLRLICTPQTQRLEDCPVRLASFRPENPYPYRPKLHYTPAYGWVNDPNGLVYYQGKYHLYHQYNPYSTQWENMSWGHAVSEDLFHWQELDVAVTPDEQGPAYSGCAFVDRKNVSGYGPDAVLFFYTAAGGRNRWSAEAGNRFTQRRMWAAAEAEMSEPAKEEAPVIPWMTEENRDPRVFWHEASQAYVMIMYLDQNEFMLLRSEDLAHWEESQRLYVPEMWECPLLMELSVEETEEKKWVFWSADGYYQVGSFDGYRFTAETGRQMAYFSRRAYAAQDYANAEGRVILVPWIRLDNDRGCYHGAMGIPQELTLKRTKDGYAVAFRMVREMEKLRQEWLPLPAEAAQSLEGEAKEIRLLWKAGTKGRAEIRIGETALHVDFDRGELRADTERLMAQEQEIRADFDPASALDLTIVIDQEMIDLLADGGRLCATLETEENVLGSSVWFRPDQEPEQAMWCTLKKTECG